MTDNTYTKRNTAFFPESLKKHPALRGRNCGCNGSFTGKIALLTVFVNDAESHWNRKAIKQFKNNVNSAAMFFLHNGGRERGLEIPCLISVSTPHYVLPSMGRNTFAKYRDWIIQSLNYVDQSFLRHDVMRQTGAQDIVVIFALNKHGTSFASCKGSDADPAVRSFPSAEEYACLFAKSDNSFFAIAHEIAHLFGALDFYNKGSYAAAALSLFPESIMLCEEREHPSIDSLTRYLIGWDRQPDAKAISFLKKTM